MGHVRLGVLPKSRKWNQVVNALRLGADIDEVAAAAADAAEASLHAASNDAAFLHAFWLLTQIPLAARGPDFAGDLRRLGVEVGNHPSLMDVVAAISAAVDRHAREQEHRTDLGEMAQMAAVESRSSPNWKPGCGPSAAGYRVTPITPRRWITCSSPSSRWTGRFGPFGGRQVIDLT